MLVWSIMVGGRWWSWIWTRTWFGDVNNLLQNWHSWLSNCKCMASKWSMAEDLRVKLWSQNLHFHFFGRVFIKGVTISPNFWLRSSWFSFKKYWRISSGFKSSSATRQWKFEKNIYVLKEYNYFLEIFTRNVYL